MWNCNEHASYQLSDAYLTKNEKVLLKRMLGRRGQNNHFFFGGKRYFYIILGKVFEHKFILHCCLFIKVWKCNFDIGVPITIWINEFTRNMPTRFFSSRQCSSKNILEIFQVRIFNRLLVDDRILFGRTHLYVICNVKSCILLQHRYDEDTVRNCLLGMEHH